MPRTSKQSTIEPGTDRTTTGEKPVTTPKAAAARKTPAAGKPERAAGAKRTAANTRRTGQDGPPPTGPEGPAAEAAEVVDVNLVVLTGRLATDAEHRTYESGAAAMRFLVTIRLSEPRQRIDVIPVTMWDPDRDLVRKPPVRGDRIWFTGNVQRRFWEAPDGRRSRVEVVAHRVERVEPAAGGPVIG